MYQQENFESLRVAECLGLQPLYAGDRDRAAVRRILGCLARGSPKDFFDVSQGGLRKNSYLHLTSNLEYQNVSATERHPKICLAFST